MREVKKGIDKIKKVHAGHALFLSCGKKVKKEKEGVKNAHFNVIALPLRLACKR